MPLLPRLSSLWRNLLQKARKDQELTEEIDAYLEMLVEQKVKEGLAPVEARRVALIELGGREQIKEQVREARAGHWIETLWLDIRYGLRTLRRNFGVAVVATLTLALGVGANTAIFSVVNAVLLRPLPYAEPDRIVAVSYHHPMPGYNAIHIEDFLAWRDRTTVFDRVAAYAKNTADLRSSGETERLDVALVSADLFSTLGVHPTLGRVFTPDEDKPGAGPVVILSYRLWRRCFGADRQVIGRPITLDDKVYTVIAIMPPGFDFPGDQDLWTPLASGDRRLLEVIARLKPGVTPEAASADLKALLESLEPSDSPRRRSEVRVVRLSELLVSDVRLALLALFGAVGFVLLIACANVANLLLARGASRQNEMAIRAALGAGRFRLIRQLLTESMILSLAGGAAALLLAILGVKLLAHINPGDIPRLEESAIDGRALGFTCAVALIVGLLAGIWPALRASKIDVSESLKARSESPGFSMSGRRAAPALMIAEFGLTLVLTIGAGLLIKSFINLLAVPKGFKPDGVLTLKLYPNPSKYPWDGPQRNAYFQELLERVQKTPGIQSAGLTSFLPLANPSMASPMRVEGRQIERGKEIPFVYVNSVSHDYFQTMGMRLLAGRQFDRPDIHGDQKVAIINEATARRFFTNENPINRPVCFSADCEKPTMIVGVIADTRQFGLERESEPEIFLPYGQNTDSNMLVARVVPGQNTLAGLSSLSAAIRDQARALDPGEPVYRVLSMDERLSDSFAPRRFQMLLFGVFAALAVTIAAIGIYGVISYAVSQRTHEIGVRMALGATPRDALRMVIRQGMLLALIGAGSGLVVAFALTRVMKNLLFNVSATDPATFAGVALFLMCVALLACYLPARRATRIDPMMALRNE